MFVTNWISTTKIQKISEITNFFRHYFLSRTEVVIRRFALWKQEIILIRVLSSQLVLVDTAKMSFY